MGLGAAPAADARDQGAPREASPGSGRLVAAWSPGIEPADSGFAERARARIRDAAFYGPPRYRNEIEQLAGHRPQAEAGPSVAAISGSRSRGSISSPYACSRRSSSRISFSASTGRSTPGMNDRRGDDPVLPREHRDEPLADRAA